MFIHFLSGFFVISLFSQVRHAARLMRARRALMRRAARRAIRRFDTIVFASLRRLRQADFSAYAATPPSQPFRFHATPPFLHAAADTPLRRAAIQIATLRHA